MTDHSVEQRVTQLEQEFVLWGRFLDEDLWRYYHNITPYSAKHLSYEHDFYYSLLEDLEKKNEEYLALVGAKWAHPDYEKVAFRLNRLLDIVTEEIEIRRNR